MENTRNHKNMKLVTRVQKYKKYVMEPNFKDGRAFETFICHGDGKNRDQDEEAGVS